MKERSEVGSDNSYVLFVIDKTQTSEDAIRLLRQNNVNFVESQVEPDSDDMMDFSDLPTMIGGRGRWSGFEAIKRFIAAEC